MSKAAFDPEKQEPKENDKCMEPPSNEREENGGNWRNRLSEFGNRTKTCASDNFKLVIILLCIMLVIFFIIIVALAVLLGKSGCEIPTYCRGSQCLRAAAGVVSEMNDSVDPCSDFFSYSCGGWERSTSPKSGSRSLTDTVRGGVFSDVRHLIDLVDDERTDNAPDKKVKLFYSICMKETELKYWSFLLLKQSIGEVGGWDIIKSPMKPSWDRTKVLAKLQASFGVQAFLKISVDPDNRNPKRSIIKIAPSGLGLPDKRFYFEDENNKYIQAYKEFIENIIKEFDSTTSTIADKFAGDMFSYEKRLARIMPDLERILDEDKEYTILTIEKLNALSPVINWWDLLQTYYPNADISMGTEVGVFFKDYFHSLSQLLSTTDNIALNNYMMWRFVSSYTPHLSKKERKIANKFYQTLNGAVDINSPIEDRWEFCIDQTIRYLGHAVSAMYVKKHFSSKIRLDVESMVENIRSSITEEINSFPWLNSAEKESAREKINLVNVQIGHPESILDNEQLETYYESFLMKTNYISNIFQGEVFLKRKEELLLQQPFSINHSWNIFSVDVKSRYSYSGNFIIIPAGLLNFPIYHIDSPLATKYGSFAAHITNKLSQAFDIRGINYQMNGVLEPWLGNNSRESYAASSECLLENVKNNKNFNLKLHSNLTVLELMDDMGGIKFTFSAYKNTKDNSGLLPGINKNNDQLFFIAYAQSLCQISQPGRIVTWNDRYLLPNRLRVLTSLQQLSEFRNAFNCPDNSAMKAEKQCHIW